MNRIKKKHTEFQFRKYFAEDLLLYLLPSFLFVSEWIIFCYFHSNVQPHSVCGSKTNDVGGANNNKNNTISSSNVIEVMLFPIPFIIPIFRWNYIAVYATSIRTREERRKRRKKTLNRWDKRDEDSVSMNVKFAETALLHYYNVYKIYTNNILSYSLLYETVLQHSFTRMKEKELC